MLSCMWSFKNTAAAYYLHVCHHTQPCASEVTIIQYSLGGGLQLKYQQSSPFAVQSTPGQDHEQRDLALQLAIILIHYRRLSTTGI